MIAAKPAHERFTGGNVLKAFEQLGITVETAWEEHGRSETVFSQMQRRRSQSQEY